MKHIVVALLASLFLSAGCASSRPVGQGKAETGSLTPPAVTFVWYSFREASGRWPTNTAEVEAFMISNHTNILAQLRQNYSNAVFTQSPDGSLTIKSKSKAGTSIETLSGR